MFRAILDTGPLVALLDRSDFCHSWASEQLKLIQAPLITCDAVIAEACFLLRRYRAATTNIGKWVKRGIIEPRFVLSREAEATFALLDRFADVPKSFADACLVRLSTLHPEYRILTLDQDFLIYRKNRRQRIPVVMPD
jgi:Predicted nucleic acid-binding protein, contains PIN domain